MNSRLLAFAITAAAAFWHGGSAGQDKPAPDAPYVERSQKQFNFYPGGKIEVVAGMPGNVEIQGWERARVVVESERIVYYLPHDKAKELAAAYPLRVRYTQTSASVTAQGPPKSPLAMETNLRLFVPREKTDLKITVAKGDFAVSLVNGWVEANLELGNVEARSVQGYFSAITKQGDLDVELSGRRWLGHGFTALTHQGNARLRMPEVFSAALQLETKAGNFTIDYPEQTVDGEKVPLLAAVKGTARNLNATVGEGGALIRISTVAGDIHVSRIPAP